MKIDTVELGRTMWLRMRLMRESELPVARQVWLWDEERKHWRPPAMVDTF